MRVSLSKKRFLPCNCSVQQTGNPINSRIEIVKYFNTFWSYRPVFMLTEVFNLFLFFFGVDHCSIAITIITIWAVYFTKESIMISVVHVI